MTDRNVSFKSIIRDDYTGHTGIVSARSSIVQMSVLLLLRPFYSSLSRKSLQRRICTVPSSDADTRCSPFAVNMTCVALSLCSLNVLTCVPSAFFHSRTVLSHDAVAMYFPSGDVAAAFTVLSWPSSTSSRSPVNESHTHAVVSLDASCHMRCDEWRTMTRRVTSR